MKMERAFICIAQSNTALKRLSIQLRIKLPCSFIFIIAKSLVDMQEHCFRLKLIMNASLFSVVFEKNDLASAALVVSKFSERFP